MHPNPIYRKTEQAESLAFARERGFGTLMINGENMPLVAHVPFRLNGAGTGAELHLMRSNPIARALGDGQPACLAVTGPDSYISPDWYELKDQVPTWNYVAVHLRGRLRRLDDADLRRVLDDLSETFETRLEPKPVWRSDKMADDALMRMMRMIAPFALEIESIDSTFKLGQNKPEAARLAAAAAAEEAAIGADLAQLSALMRTPPKA